MVSFKGGGYRDGKNHGGIGSAICKALATEGSNVALSYRLNAAAADKVMAEVEAVWQKALTGAVDLEDPASVHAIVETTVAEFG